MLRQTFSNMLSWRFLSNVGRVHFQTSCTPQAQQKFDCGLAIPGSLSTGSTLESTMKGNCNE